MRGWRVCCPRIEARFVYGSLDAYRKLQGERRMKGKRNYNWGSEVKGRGAARMEVLLSGNRWVREM